VLRLSDAPIEACTRNLTSPRDFESVPKLLRDISVEGSRSARFDGIVYGSKMTKG